ncbi:hypothetical protein [Hymenobacter sp. 102]|uniref:hypothetical protein n=1 Tax=Hymenobacter sp. 102 TaxID=3403152 RepID=UPI003CED9984
MNTSEIPIKPRYRIRSVLACIITVTMGAALAVFAAFVLKAILNDFSGLGLFIYLMLISISGMALLGGLTNSFGIRVAAKDARIDIYYLYFFKKRYSAHDFVGYKMYTHLTKYGVYQAFFIETERGTQFAFNEFQLSNYIAIRSAVEEVLPNNASLQLRLWRLLPRQFYIGMLAWVVLCHALALLK